MFFIHIVVFICTVVDARNLDISLNSTWRCGVFIPIPDEKYQEPLAKYFVLQNQLPAKCPATFKDTYKFGAFSKNCGKMGQNWEKLWSPSRSKETGAKYG